MNKIIQTFEVDKISYVDFRFEGDDFIILVDYNYNIFTGFTYVNSTNKLFLHDSLCIQYKTSLNRERREFISYLENEFKITIKRTNLDNE